VRVSINIPNHAELLKSILAGCIDAGTTLVASGAAPPGPPENFELHEDRNEQWQLPDESADLGSGDCEDCVIWRCSTLRASGEDPEASAEILQVGRRDLHCVVRRGSGEIEDIWNDLKDGSYRLGFGFGDVVSSLWKAPLALAKGVASAGSTVFGSGSGGRMPTNNYSGAGAPNLAVATSEPTGPQTLQPQPQQPGTFNGIPTMPAMPGGYYPGGYYPQEPYPGIPWGQVDDVDDDDDDDDDVELERLRKELKRTRRALAAKSANADDSE
jgi:hypothetical protein